MQEKEQSSIPNRFSPYFLITLVTVAAWLPFGQKITPIAEMWFMQSQVESIQGIIGSWNLQPDRIFWFWSVLLGYWLTPDTFEGQQIVFIGVYILRGTLTYLVLLKLFPKLKAWALTTAVLSLFCPADNNGFWLGALHVHAHDALFLLPIYIYLHVWEKPKLWKWVVLIFFQNIVLWSYEGTLLLNMTVPMLSFYLENSWKPSKLALKNWLFWYISPIIAILIRLNMFINADEAHFVRKIDRSFDLLGVLDGLLKAFYVLFIDWLREIKLVFQHDAFLGYTIAVFILFAGYLWLSSFNLQEEANKNINNISTRISIGITLIGVGFLPYSLTDLLRYRYDRTLILPWLGASIILSTIIWELNYKITRKGYIAFITSSLLIASTLSFSMHHRQARIVNMNYQDQVLSQIISNIPSLQKGTAILLICEDCPRITSFKVDTVFNGALRFIYDDYTLRGFTYHYSTVDNTYYKPSGESGKLDEFPLNRLVILRYSASEQKITVAQEIPTEVISAENPTFSQYAPSLRYESDTLLPYRACLLFDDELAANLNGCKTAP